MHEMPIVAGEDECPLVFDQSLGQCLDGIDVEMVSRLVHHENVVLAEQQSREAKTRSLASGKHLDPS